MPRNLSVEERAQIIAQKKKGCNIREIARNLNISRPTVRFCISRGEDNLTDRSRSGRRPGPRKAQRKAESIDDNNTHTKKFAELFKASIQTRTHLHNIGHIAHHYTKIVILDDDEKAARLSFALKYLEFDWSNTIFCSAKTVQYNNDGSLHLEHYTLEEEGVTIPSNAANMWGWMTVDGVGELCSLPPQVSKTSYIDVLQNVMVPTVRNVYPENEVPRINVVQDNYLSHEKFLQDLLCTHPDTEIIPWPAKSSDLNPIENLWGLMVHRWYIATERTRVTLEGHCKMIWEEMRGIDVCTELVGSMRELLQAVIKANGDYVRQ